MSAEQRTDYGFVSMEARTEDFIERQERMRNLHDRVAVPVAAPAATVSALDVQVGGDHYKSMPIQPMEFSMLNKLDACQHTIIKYVARFRVKGGLEDLKKARHTLDMLIEFETRHGKRT